MKIAILVKGCDELTGEETGEVLETIVVALQEPDGQFVDVELVEDDEDHWANSFNVWRYRAKDLKQLLVEDKPKRVSDWLDRSGRPDTRGGL